MTRQPYTPAPWIRVVLIALVAMALTGFQGGCEVSEKPDKDAAEIKKNWRACKKASRANKDVNGVVVDDVHRTPDGPYCLKISIDGDNGDPDGDNGDLWISVKKYAFHRCGWNAPYPKCAGWKPDPYWDPVR